MTPGINVEITLRDGDKGSYLRIPVTPSVLHYNDGRAMRTTARILDLGNVDFINGVELDGVRFNSFFPARYDPSYCKTSDLQQPTQYVETLQEWKRKRVTVQFILPAYSINKPMYIEGLDWQVRGFEGDVYYSLNLKEVRTISPRQLSAGDVPVRAASRPEDRPKKVEQPKAKHYTVKAGDYLIRIAKSKGISDWRRDLYEPNKDIIGPDPGLIQPGQKLKLPA